MKKWKGNGTICPVCGHTVTFRTATVYCSNCKNEWKYQSNDGNLGGT